MNASRHESESIAGVTPRTRASKLLRVRSVWIAPLTLAAILVFFMSLFYVGAIVNPAGHLSGLPVAVVNEDRGATVQGHHVDFGAEMSSGLLRSQQLTSRLSLKGVSHARAAALMDGNQAYAAIVSILCGFLGAVLVNSSIDAALGYATSEVGPRWRQRIPVAISRWQTLLAKWAVTLVAAPVLTGIMLVVAVGLLHLNAPHAVELWLFTSFASAVIAVGTLALFAAFGALGQLLAMLLFVYLALASSGGTVPLQALPPFFRFAAGFEPLRQVLGGVRAILYFNARGDAGLARGVTLTAIGLVFWLIVGAAVTRWYDRRGMDRLSPDVLEFLQRSATAELADTPSPATMPN